MSFVTHIVVLGLLIVDLAVGGPAVNRLAGHWALAGFEFMLILGYVLFILRLGPPWNRPGGPAGPGDPNDRDA